MQLVDIATPTQLLLKVHLKASTPAVFSTCVMLICDIGNILFNKVCDIYIYFKIIHSFKLFLYHFFKSTSTQRRSQHSMDTAWEFHAKAHRQLRVKDLPKVSTWRPERDSNPRPFRRKVLNQPMSHHAPLYILHIN